VGSKTAAAQRHATPSTAGVPALVGVVNAQSPRRSSRRSSAPVSKNPVRLSSKFFYEDFPTKTEQSDLAGKHDGLITMKR
jgi:hypothetical protein